MECENLNLRHVRAFYEVGRAGSVTAATRRVFLSQSAITQAIANLERLFDTRLFTREKSGMVLTEPGGLFFNRARRALTSIQTGARRAQRGVEKPTQKGLPKFEHSLTSAQLRSLIAIDQLRNFSLAARSIGVSQPSLYRAARDLERIAGLTFFNSNSRGVELTLAAQTFARFVRLAFAELNQGYDEISAWRGRDTSRISIGTLPLSRSYVLPRAIDELTRLRPNVLVRVTDGSYADLLKELREGALDFIIGGQRDPLPVDDVVQRHLFDDPLSVVARVGHPLASAPRITLKELATYPWIVSRLGAPIRASFEGLFRDAGLARPEKLIESNSLVLIRDLLAESDRLALISMHQVEKEMAQGIVMKLDVADLNPEQTLRTIGMTFRRDWHPTGTQSLLLDLLDKAASEMPNPELNLVG